MGFFDSIKAALGTDANDEDMYDETDMGGYENNAPAYSPAQNDGSFAAQNNRPRNENGGRLNISVTAQLQVILVKPEKFSDTKEIANHLNNKKTVVLNLEQTTPDVTRRIIDFLGGVAYANSGSIKPVANNTFIITPYNVGFQGEELSAELDRNGVLN